MVFCSSPAIYKCRNILRRLAPYVQFDWRNYMGLRDATGRAITCSRATNTTSLRSDGSYDFVPANAIGSDHYVGGAYTDLMNYRTQPADWVKVGFNTATNTGVQSILPSGKNLIRWTATGSSTVHYLAYTGAGALTAGDVYSGKLICKDVNQQYIMLICGVGASLETYYLRIDLVNKTAVSASTGAHTTTFTATVITNIDGSLTINYSWTCPITEGQRYPYIVFTDATWAETTTASGSVDFACLTCVKSPFQVPIIYSSPEATGVYAGAATALLLSTSPIIGNGDFTVFSVANTLNQGQCGLVETRVGNNVFGLYLGNQGQAGYLSYWLRDNSAHQVVGNFGSTNYADGIARCYGWTYKHASVLQGYVNGVQSGTNVDCTTLTDVISPVGAMGIGSRTTGSAFYLNGNIKNVLIINKYINSYEAVQIANALLRISQ
jgi:hypothetical protein